MRAPPDAANSTNGCRAYERCAHRGDHRLAGGGSERPAHEVKVLDGGHDRVAVQLADAGMDRIVETGLAARVLQAIGVAALVAELQRIERHVGEMDGGVFLVVEQRL